MSKTIDFCTYYSQSGTVIVNVTDHILRIKENDGTIIELPSSVLPQDIPDSYKVKAKKLKTTVKEVCNSSIFAKVEREWIQANKYAFREIFKSNKVLDIVWEIQKEYSHSNLFIVGTHIAARAFPSIITEPFYIDEQNYLIEADKFRFYNVDF